MRFPVLTPTDAPAFFSEAFEDAEREYWSCWAVFPPGTGARANKKTLGCYLTRESALARAELLGGWDPEPYTAKLDHFLSLAKELGIPCVVLRDAQGNELKRWPVDR